MAFLLSKNGSLLENKKIVLYSAAALSLTLTIPPPRGNANVLKERITSYLPLIFSASALAVKFFSGEQLLTSEIYISLGYLIGFYSLFIFISYLIPWQIIKKVYAVFLSVLFLFPSAGIWFYYCISGSFLHPDTIMAVLQTNGSEAASFFMDHITASGMLSLFLFFLLLYLSARGIASSPDVSWKNRKNILLAVLILLSSGDVIKHTCHRADKNIFYALYKGTAAYMQKYTGFSQKAEERKKHIHNIVPVSPQQDKGVFVLVIGESQNRLHMHAYGYDRNTTPWLDKEKNKNNFLLFTNAYSCHTHTVPVLTYALTAKNQYNKIPLADAVSLLEVAQAAGYDTAWISNQVQYSAWDTPITVIASEAKHQMWFNKNVGETTKTNFYDEKVVSGLQKLPLSDKMLIVIHLMGDHGSYTDRYPKKFSCYQGKGKDIDAYDNSIRYNDWVVSQIYQTVKKIPYFQGMVYFSDHTDAVDQHLGHDASQFVYPMTYIPMYMVFSPDYMKNHAGIMEQLREHQNSYFTNDLIFNTVLGLMQIQVSGLYEPNNDLTAASYDASPGRFKTLYGKKKILDKDKK